MFVPIEAAFSAAVTAEPDLIEYAIAQGVLLTTPTTLLGALRTVANVWDIEKRQQNAEQIAERAGALYDKVVGFLDSMDKVGPEPRPHQERLQRSPAISCPIRRCGQRGAAGRDAARAGGQVQQADRWPTGRIGLPQVVSLLMRQYPE